ncbi:MAG TPA: G1 family glutamic endopeptidase [Gemmataceae bacterium]|jgi:hypothetical protein
MPTIKLGNGVTARTFTPPPQSFQPLKATRRDLLRYGFPPQPKEPPLLRLWEVALSRPLEMIQPRFRTLVEVDYKLPKTSTAPAAPPHPPPMRSNVIGGATVTAAAGQGTVRWVGGTWTIPNIYPHVGSENGVGYPFLTEVFISGKASTSSLAVGWSGLVFYSGRSIQRRHGVWWRWAPGDFTGLSNFFVDPGDTLGCVICLDLGSTVRARLSFHNLTTSQATSFIVTAPSGTELTGDTAGWLIQNGVVDFHGPFIARFGEFYIDECNAGTTDSPAILHPAQAIYLIDFDTGEDVAYTNILSDTLLQFRYVGA